MSDRLIIDIDPKEHSREGHTRQCYLEFNGRRIWGTPVQISCHDNSTRIADALKQADPRFDLFLSHKSHSVEGHIATITIKKGDTVYLDKLSTHDNMTGLRDAVRKALDDDERNNSKLTLVS
ncbi:hypothetical protein Hte_006967 [Hypoxylon texense]